ncbi:LPXTG cell wall anchor domain-containing protein, partial [Staphylococcus haemolyticus]
TAKEVSENGNATAEEVKTATDALNAAIKAKETQDASDLSNAKEKTKSLIEKLEDITDQQKGDFVDRIEKALSIDEIDKIVEEAKTKDLEMHALKESKKQAIEKLRASELEKAKALGKQEVEGLIYLSDETKAGYKDQINKAKTQAEIDEIVNNAIKENQATNHHGNDSSSHSNHGNKSTDNTNDNHPGTDNPNGQETDNHNNGSNNTSGITIDHASIDKAKKEATQFINQLPKLTEQQQANFNQRIDNADSIQAIQDIVDEASVVNNHLPDTGIEDNNSTTIFGSVITFLAGLLLLRRRKDKKSE